MPFRPQKPRAPGTLEQVFSAMVAEAGSLEEAALLLGLGRTQVAYFTDPDVTDRKPSYAQARQLARAVRSRAFAQDAAALAGGVFTPVAPAQDAAERLIAVAAGDFGQFMGKVVAALSDGALAPEEARGLAALLDDVLPLLAQARAQLGRA